MNRSLNSAEDFYAFALYVLRLSGLVISGQKMPPAQRTAELPTD